MKRISLGHQCLKLMGGILTAALFSQQSAVLAQESTMHPDYQKAKAELPANYFVIYAITDRIARANGLDNKPWRIVVTSDYNINAYASETNVLTFEEGLMDQLEGNASALACAVGHEMAHHVKQHLGYGPAKQEEARLEALRQAEEDKVVAEKDAKTQALIGQGVSAGTNELGDSLGGIGGDVIKIGGGILSSGSQDDAQNIDQIKADIDAQAQENFEQKKVEIRHEQELEADEFGYLYSVTAGFDPNGCTGVMDILGRMPGAQLAGDTHPAPEDRTSQIEDLIAEHPPETLKAEGKSTMASKPTPLKYESFSQQVGEGVLTGLKIYPITGSTENDLENYLN